MMRKFEEAVPKLLLEIQNEPEFPPAYRIVAACYAHMGRLSDAREVYERLRSINPRAVVASGQVYRNPKHRELLLSGLRLAAGETI